MKKSNDLLDLINQLKNLFVYKDEILLYNEKTQAKANILLEQIATLTETFNNTIKNEKRKVRKELTITDTFTGERRELVDIDSIDGRVKNVLKGNNMFSCLKSLALCNKCAHNFDGNIKKIRNDFINYYDVVYPNEINLQFPTEKDKKDNLTFMQPLSVKFPKVINSIPFHLNNIDDNEIKKIIDLNNQKKYAKGLKIHVLRQLNISFDIEDDKKIDEVFDKVISNKNKIVNAFLEKKYNEGMEQVKLQNRMFAIKDYYISMIGQLLQKGAFKNVKYELIKTSGDGVKSGFEYMLIIDDKSLSYYIEVHMPNFISTSLIREYGLVESTERTTQRLGASAVYKRETSEIREIYKALNNNFITDGRVRGEIISRNYPLEFSDAVKQENNGDSENYSEYSSDDYSFITRRIADKPIEFEEYLKYKNMFNEVAENNKFILLNENYPEKITKEIVCNNYLNIFNSLNYYNKNEFILYSLDKLKNEDIFDKYLFNLIKNNYMNYDINQLAKIIIYKNNLKSDFLDKNINKINEILDKRINKINEILYNQNNNKSLNKLYNSLNYKDNNINNILTDENKESINLLIEKYISDYIESENNKEIDNDGPKHQR